MYTELSIQLCLERCEMIFGFIYRTTGVCHIVYIQNN